MNRVYAQYADKPKAVEWYNIVPSLSSQIDNTAQIVRKSYDIDSSSGAQLDAIGRIVNIDRSFESSVVFIPLQWGQIQWGGLNTQWASDGTVFSNTVSDSIYRVLLKAKIAKNNSESTLDGIVDALRFITGVDDVTVIDNEDMTFSVSFGRTLNSTVKFVLDTFDIVPRPQGVQFLGYTEEVTITQWGGQFGWGSSEAQFGQFFGV